MSGPAFDIDEFCQRNYISRGTFYNLRKQGNGPRVMKVGGRTIITPEAEDDWRRNMEEKVAKPQSRPTLRNLMLLRHPPPPARTADAFALIHPEQGRV